MPPRKTARSTPDAASLSEDDLVGAPQNVKIGTKRKADAVVRKAPRQVLKDRTNISSAAQDEEVQDDQPAKRPKSVKSARSAPQEKVAASTGRGVDSTKADQVTSEPYVRAASIRPCDRARSSSANAFERDRRGDSRQNTDEIEELRLRNQALEDLVKTRAESNFEKLRAEAEQKSRRADELIASLRREIATLRKTCSSNSTDTSVLQGQVRTLTEACEAHATSNKRLLDETLRLKADVQARESERQSLEVKLMAARQHSTGPAGDAKVPISRTAVSNGPEGQKEMRMKEELYSDLTGLIICGVKRKDGEDQYDCVQTGRNGTLHFRLSIMNESSAANPKTPSAYEDAEFSYEPKLDDNRDQMLLDILPDYLSEDICFPRSHAVKFYSKVVESMTKRVVVEEDEP